MALLGPEKMLFGFVTLLVVASVVLTVIAPKVLGQAMDVIFNGILGAQLPAGVPKEQIIEGFTNPESRKKLIADPDTGQLLGAHILGPQATVLIQPLIQAMSFGLDVASMARGQYWIHPSLTEVVENALLKLGL